MLGLGVVWATVLVVGRLPDPDLTVVLLAMVLEVLAIGVVVGPLGGVGSALAAVVLVNWYLVPPYHTFVVESPENVTALVVFTAVAVSGSLLVELGLRARAQTRLIGDVVALPSAEPAGAAAEPLELVRHALDLDRLVLLDVATPESPVELQASGPPVDAQASPAVDLALPGDYRLVGFGPPRIAVSQEFLGSLGAAVVRSYEGDRLEAERRRAEDLAALDQARAALLASVGHDLRTPLAGLRVSVDALAHDGPALSERDRRELLDTIASSADRLDELITNLLDLSRIEAGALPVRREPTDLGEVVARALLALPGVERVAVDVDDMLPAVDVDPALLERVVANLVSNALRHSPPGTPVAVVAVRAGGGVRLAVVDHGPGIPAERRAEVVRPFRRTGGRGDRGSGLGLAIVDGFCRAMALPFDLSDTPGGGLTAQLHLPVEGP